MPNWVPFPMAGTHQRRRHSEQRADSAFTAPGHGELNGQPVHDGPIDQFADFVRYCMADATYTLQPFQSQMLEQIQQGAEAFHTRLAQPLPDWEELEDTVAWMRAERQGQFINASPDPTNEGAPVMPEYEPRHRVSSAMLCSQCHFLFHDTVTNLDVYMCETDTLTFVNASGQDDQHDDFMQRLDPTMPVTALTDLRREALRHIAQDQRFERLMSRRV